MTTMLTYIYRNNTKSVSQKATPLHNWTSEATEQSTQRHTPPNNIKEKTT